MALESIVWTLLGVGTLVLVFGTRLRRVRRWFLGPGSRAGHRGHCVRCGYDLTGLPFPRCPECGALPGFKVSIEELGLSEEELRERYAETQNGAGPSSRAPDAEAPDRKRDG